jgi:hypothetical protein
MSWHREFDEDKETERTAVSETGHELPPNWRPGADTISAIQCNEAYQAAEDALSESDISSEHLLYARRYASEAAARASIGNDAVDLDKVVKDKALGFQGDNYPVYDVTSRSEVASVKTHWSSNGELDNAIAAYKRDFAQMLGWNRTPDALAKDGENIIAIRDAGAPVPKGLADATVEGAAEYLRDNSCLRIPDDHVDTVRAELEQDVRSFPSNYYLPENPSDEQVKHVVERLRSIGLTSDELQEMIDRRMRG